MRNDLSKNHRPKILLKSVWIDYVLEFVSLAIFLSIIVMFFAKYKELPDNIPTHYTFEGKADKFGSKNELWILMVVTIAIYSGLSVLKKYPHIFNFPVEITAQNVLYQYTLAVRMLRVLKVIILAIFFQLFYSVVNMSVILPFYVLLIELFAIFFTLIIYLILAAKKT